MTRERTGPVINIVLRVEWIQNYLLGHWRLTGVACHASARCAGTSIPVVVGHLEHEFLLFYVRLLLVD
jgi:hypothetical protein